MNSFDFVALSIPLISFKIPFFFGIKYLCAHPFEYFASSKDKSGVSPTAIFIRGFNAFYSVAAGMLPAQNILRGSTSHFKNKGLSFMNNYISFS